jgi:ubiquinone/menaquinone biosynthesis C-methylase UbiE
MTKNQIKNEFVKLLQTGTITDLTRSDQVDTFRVSMDRYSEIIFAFQGRKRVLDVGCGGGIMLSMLKEMGHDCHGVDFTDCTAEYPHVYQDKEIPCKIRNVEKDVLPFPDNFFDAVACGQCLEHFTHSHLPAMREFYRVLKPSGLVSIDVPNVACLRNRWRMIRGMNITWDYEKHYLDAAPILKNGRSYFPHRHNREFTIDELSLLMCRSGVFKVETRFIKSRRFRTGIESIRSLGSVFRDLFPSLRKSIIGFGVK